MSIQRFTTNPSNLYLVWIALLISSCDEADNSPISIQPSASVRALSAEEAEVSSGAGNFALDLMEEIEKAEPNTNFFISSFSVSTAVSMVMNGASKEAKEEFIQTLQLEGMSAEKVNEAYQSLTKYIYALDSKVILNIANSNWYHNDYTIQSNFKSTLSTYYDAEIFDADFRDETTLKSINGWVEENTNGKIKDILESIRPREVMFLINAIYFKAEWATKFKEESTRELPFTLADGSSIEVPTMTGEIKHWIAYWNKLNATVVEIPYGNENYGLTIIMPDNPATLEGMVAQIDMGAFSEVMKDTTVQTRQLFLPKITLDFKKDLKDILVDMGMPLMGLSNLFEETVPLEISKVIHQSFLEINEEGTEAAAATAIGVMYTSIPATTQINKPFLFFIRERNSNTILFSGKLVDPS